MIDTIKKALNELGLSNNETNVLLVLLQERSLKVHAVSKFANLNRTTTYGVLKSLITKGLVSSINRKGISEFQAIEPDHLVNYIDKKQQELNTQKEEIKKVLPELKKMQTKKNPFPRVRFFEGLSGMKQAYEDTLENNREKKLLDLTGTDAVFKRMGQEWVEYYVQKRTRLGIACIDIAPNTEWSRASRQRDEELLRVTKLIPERYSFDTEIDIYDNKIGIFSFSENQPLAVIIEDEKISHTLKMLFQYIESTLSQNT